MRTQKPRLPKWVVLAAPLCLFGPIAAAPSGAILRAAVLDLALGVNGSLNPADGNAPMFLHLDVASVYLGRRFDRHWGAGLGTSAISGDLINTLGFFPVSGSVFYDLDPEARWRRRMAHASVTFVYNEGGGWSGAQRVPYLTAAVGISYTFYLVSPRLEVGYHGGREAFTCAAGLGIPGGTYVLHRAP